MTEQENTTATPPTADQITQLVADHYAFGNSAIALGWLAAIDFKAAIASAGESVAA